MNTRAVLDFLLPAKWRRRQAADPARNSAVLARLDDSDPVYRMLMDHAYARAQSALRELMEPHCTDVGIHYWRGQLAGLAEHIEEIEQRRLAWKEQARASVPQAPKGVL